ncbi:MAG: cellulase family glycosylhydrolase, partial [Paludibacteraceae bacterium]
MTEKVKEFITLTDSLGMYCLVDWQATGNPTDSTFKDAPIFFNDISEYSHSKGYKHVLYEIFNEPHSVSWTQIKQYANQILPIIQSNDSGAVVVVGTPQWDQNIGDAASSPITGYSDLNIMYAFHFYSCSHYQFLSALDNASKSIPVFISEWSIAKFDGGDGTREVESTCISNADALMRTAKSNQGGQRISWCNWSWSDRNNQTSTLMDCGSMVPSMTGNEVIRLSGKGGCCPPPCCFSCYSNTCSEIPGILDLGHYDVNIEAEEEIIGQGEGITYHEENTTPEEAESRAPCNSGFRESGKDYQFRINECVDVAPCYGLTNTEGWHTLTSIEANEWIIYTVNVDKVGYYSVEALCNPNTKQTLSITSQSYSYNLLYNLDTKKEAKDISFVGQSSCAPEVEWKTWGWENPVQNIGADSTKQINTGVLFKEAGSHTIKIAF